jgi:hypothetical protein
MAFKAENSRPRVGVFKSWHCQLDESDARYDIEKSNKLS